MVADRPNLGGHLVALGLAGVVATLLAAALVVPSRDDVGLGRRARMPSEPIVLDEPTRHP
jgi:hypothetical protein